MNNAPGHAADTANNFALIIGISRYRDENVNDLNFTQADARSFHELLVDPERAGFPPGNVRLLLDEDATRYAIEDAVSGWLRRRAKPDSKVVVFFAGHGAAEADHTGGEDSVTYLLPHDARSDNLFASAISTNRFQRLLASVRSDRLATFLDACHSGAFEVKGARSVAVQPTCYHGLGRGKGRILIAAAQPHQFSFEDGTLGHGVFTHHLVEALGGAADFDGDGRVTIQEVFKYLADHVPETVRKLGKQGNQEPLMEGVTTRDIVLAIDPQRVREADEEVRRRDEQRKQVFRERMRQLADLRADGQLPADVYHEAIHLLESAAEDLDPQQGRLLANLKAVLAGGLSAELYLINREAIAGHGKPQAREASAGSTGVGSSVANEPPRPVSERRFCIACGARASSSDAFCTQCGRRVG